MFAFNVVIHLGGGHYSLEGDKKEGAKDDGLFWSIVCKMYKMILN